MGQASAPHWRSYQLIDTGEGLKVEQFGHVRLIRPEPQAVWPLARPLAAHLAEANGRFVQTGPHAGNWQTLRQPLPESWEMAYLGPDYKLRFRLALTAFKHVGVFPEQAVNWDFVVQQCRLGAQATGRPPRVLNLFAYTGGATLAAWAAGAQATHLDAVRQVVNWAADNLRLNGGDGAVRWLVDDALKFVQREARRGAQYDGLLLDPPAFGHGPKGERWKLEDQISELLGHCAAILHPQGFLVFNGYSLGFSPLILENLVRHHFAGHGLLASLNAHELYLPDEAGRRLPCGVVVRLGRV